MELRTLEMTLGLEFYRIPSESDQSLSQYFIYLLKGVDQNNLRIEQEWLLCQSSLMSICILQY